MPRRISTCGRHFEKAGRLLKHKRQTLTAARSFRIVSPYLIAIRLCQWEQPAVKFRLQHRCYAVEQRCLPHRVIDFETILLIGTRLRHIDPSACPKPYGYEYSASGEPNLPPAKFPVPVGHSRAENGIMKRD
jgi:hypothetical protein